MRTADWWRMKLRTTGMGVELIGHLIDDLDLAQRTLDRVLDSKPTTRAPVRAVFNCEGGHIYIVGLPYWPMSREAAVMLCPEMCVVCGALMDRTIGPPNNSWGVDFTSKDGAYGTAQRERSTIATWLRDEKNWGHTMAEYADAIERGEHDPLSPPPPISKKGAVGGG